MHPIVPRCIPELDPGFRPAILTNLAFREAVASCDQRQPACLALEQADGSVFHYRMDLPPDDHALASDAAFVVERLVKFLLWSRGAYRIYFAGPASIVKALCDYSSDDPRGRFDAEIMGTRIYGKPFEIRHVALEDIPPEKAQSRALGRNLDGCRIGFDLGASDRKVAAVLDGEAVFSEEIEWNPSQQRDPQWHVDQIMDSLQRAAAHLPRVDAIGGSAAGVYVNNRVKVASLFRSVPPELFESRVKDIFLEIQQKWNGIPLDVVNDGEVTALAGSMSLGANAMLGIAMGSSEAVGFVNREGNITSWLNELAFAPVDYQPQAPVDEWSGDRGCGALYFSQQAVGRLTAQAGLTEIDGDLPLPDKLKQVQALMANDDARAARIYRTIGVYLGYSVAHYADFYEMDNILILGRVTSGDGGEQLLTKAREVLDREFPELSQRIKFHIPDEKDKRHGQAVAAASLPVLHSSQS